MKPPLQKVEAGEIEPSFVITHRVPLEQAPEAYKTFCDKEGLHQSRAQTLRHDEGGGV
jgi:threonine dehydrogenase-like Zn-dependent dehydrogenase